MTLGLKVAAFSLTGGVATAALELVVWPLLLQASPSPVDVIGGGVTGGVIVGAVAWATYKAKVDEHDRRIQALDSAKADKDIVAQMSKSIDKIEEHVTWLVREKRGE